MKKTTAYRTNERAACCDVAARKNRLWDHVLYIAPLRRLAYIIVLLLPATAAAIYGHRMHGADTMALGLVLYVLGTMLLVVPTAPMTELPESKFISQRRKLLLFAYLPFTILTMLGSWIMTGDAVPEWWKDA